MNCLTTAELKADLGRGSNVNNWSQVRPGFPNVPLRLFGPGTDSGTFEFFTEKINGRARQSRSDYSASEDDNVLVRGVSGERGALGYWALVLHREQEPPEGSPGERRRLRHSERRERPEPLVQAALPRALRLLEEEGLQARRRRRFHPAHDRQRESDLAPRIVPDPGRIAEASGSTTPRSGTGRTTRRTRGPEWRHALQHNSSRLRATRRRWGEDVVKLCLALCAFVSVATTVGIVVALFVPAIEFFSEISIADFLTGTDWAPLFEPPSFGVLLIAGTLLVTGCACLVCIPFGLGSAIYLSEYARPRTRKYLKPRSRSPAHRPWCTATSH